ncbi:MAG: M20/M25/M40 family metallo-hydrolase [Actinobacteria bacterium]|nr:M20/M25/M40 family metallo-hydrolase [Actinomycetota bacterium]
MEFIVSQRWCLIEDMSEPDGRVRSEATSLLRDLIRIDTSNPPGRETPAAKLLLDYLEAAGVSCELVARDPERANLIARIPGTGEGPSLAFMGHTDVVPADAADWEHPPFSGHLDGDGFVWGRGAVDMKNQTATRAVAVAELARSGFRPRGDLVFIAQADEESGTEDAGLKWLRGQRPDIGCDYSIDEGGGERLELTDGRVVVPINTGEKATLPVLITALGEAGHASIPQSGDNAVPRLAVLIDRLARHRTQRILRPETHRLLEVLIGPHEGGLDAAIEQAAGLHPSFADDLPPLFGSTIAPTRLFGSAARNVMPGRAAVECDCRVLPETTPEDLERELRSALGHDISYELEFLEPPTGGTVAPVDTPLFDVCQDFLHDNDPGAALLPVISTGFCDSHFMREAFDTVAYGFWPLRRTPIDIYHDGFHNRNERIHADDLAYAVDFHLYAARRILGDRDPAGL